MTDITPRLMIVDDDVHTGSLFRRVAEGAGYEVVVATRAEQARSAFPAFAPHVLILDMVMPDEDGLDLLKWFCGAGFRGRMIVVSGFSEVYLESAVHIAQGLGVEDVRAVPKPVHVADLRTALADPPKESDLRRSLGPDEDWRRD